MLVILQLPHTLLKFKMQPLSTKQYLWRTSYYIHIIKDFSQVTISISPNYLGEIKMDYINAMAFFKTQKINSAEFLWQDLLFIKSCFLTSLMSFNWQFFVDTVPNYHLVYLKLEWKPKGLQFSGSSLFILFEFQECFSSSPILGHFPGLRPLKVIIAETEPFASY